MADGLRLLSNGYGFYEAFSVPPYALPKPQTAPVHHNIEYHPELKIEFDQYPITRFFSPGELSTPPDTPASMVASPPPPPPPFPPPSTALSMQAEPKWWCPTPLSNEDARQRIGAYIPSARWFENNMPEPLVGDADVPACAQLLARRGESIYRCFVDTRKGQKGKSVYYCTECGFMSDRLHRLLGHQRSKRGHRPFACPDEGWYVHPSRTLSPNLGPLITFSCLFVS